MLRSNQSDGSGRWRGLYAAVVTLMVSISPHASGQVQYDVGGSDVVPAACHGTEEFYSIAAYPYFEADGYFFDANPFVLAKWTSTSSGIYRSTRGYSLVDVSGTKVWTDTRLAAACFEFNLGLVRVHFAKVLTILGTVVDRSTACNGSGASGPFTAIDYDPYDPGGTTSFECGSDPTDNSGEDDGGAECRSEYVIIEVSNDGGATWQTLWEGMATVC